MNEAKNLHRNNAAEWVMWALLRPIQWIAGIAIRLAGPLAGRSAASTITVRKRTG